MDNNLRKTSIYFLIDPRNSKIRYVGKTVQKLEYRLRQHLTEKSNHRRSNWIKSLQILGLKPIIIQVHNCPWNLSSEFEINMISACKKWGMDLTNLTDGGDGCIGYKPNEEQRKRIKLAAIKRSKEYSSPRKGIKHTEESKKKMSNSRIGRIRSKESIEKQVATLKRIGRKPSQLNIKNMIESTRKEVLKLSFSGEFIEKYYSINQAGRENGVHGGKITMCCQGKRNSAGGFKWSYS